MLTKKRYNRKTTGITISIFYEQHQLKKYNFVAPYQRDYNVWVENQKSFLIDTIMKNFPMPPIFLEQKIDAGSGKTSYDVIDGKQRLSTIIDFIENKIKLPQTFGNDNYGSTLMNGKSFEEIKELAKNDDEIKEFISDFWGYVINIEYIENPDIKIVDNIFDRLNRGGERLNNQELRKANYYDSIMYQAIEELRSDNFISEMLNNLNKNRLEDVSFITEIYLLILTGEIIDGTESQIDEYFKKLVDTVDGKKSNEVVNDLNAVKEIVESFKLDYDKYRIKGVSHLYAIWYLAHYIYINKIDLNKEFFDRLNDFFEDLREEKRDGNTAEYHKSMQSASKFKHSRKRRVNALLKYFGFSTV